jgi:hypothetical protein
MRLPDITPRTSPVWGGHSCAPNASSKIAQAGNFYRCFVVALLLTAFTPGAAAQRTAPAHAAAPHTAIPRFNLPTGSFALGRGAYPSRFRSPFPYTSLPLPFFGDSFNLDDLYSTGYPVASQPPVFLLQAAHALSGPADYAAAYPAIEPAIPQPLMIELQNGRYVRVNSTPADGEALPLTAALDRAQSEQTQPAKSTRANSTRLAKANSADQPTIAAAPPAHDLPPALLVFRDGHSEEVRDYTIADGVLYARGDYYTDGYWNKKIDLAALNVAETMQANSNRNVKFILPSSPNEVITRP